MSINTDVLKTKIKILVCCHKKSDLPNNDDGVFLPIHVGATISDQNLGIQKDSELNNNKCDNISGKNKSYCELTALYWAWKNIKKIYPNTEYIGLNHYRRFFNFTNVFARDWNYKAVKDVTNYRIDYTKLRKLLSKNIGIMAKKKIYPYSLAVDYSVAHVSDDLRILGEIIKEKYSDYYPCFIKFFYCNNKLSHFNMFIWKYDGFEKYCEWLFGILFEAEKRIDISNYSDVQKRIWGYMAERLLNIYVEKNKMSIKYLPVNVYNGNKENIIKYIINRVRYNIAFHLSKPKFSNVWIEKNQ